MVCPNPRGHHGHHEGPDHNDGDGSPDDEGDNGQDNGEENGTVDPEALSVQNGDDGEEEDAPEAPVLICVTPTGVSAEAPPPEDSPKTLER
jgi:hypothetical protein